jgi:hypothetical protein
MSTNETALAVPEGMVCISKGAEVEFIYPVHAEGWRAKGWEVTAAGAAPPRPPGKPEQPGKPEVPGRPQPPEVVDPENPEPPEGGGGAGECEAPAPLEQPEPPDGGGEGGTEAQSSVDFGAMTKAEIISYCKDNYGVLLDSSLTKAALVEQAEALAAEAAAEGEEEPLVPGDLLI